VFTTGGLGLLGEQYVGVIGDAPGLQAGDSALDRRSCSGKCPGEGFFGGSEFLQGPAFDAGVQPRAGTLVGEIGQDGNALALADPDDPVGTGGGQVVSAARQGG